jgi:hypothetical protein
MKRIINTLIISAASAFLFSCQEKENVYVPMNESIVINLSDGSTKADLSSAEAFVNHLDVFIFKADAVKADSQLKSYSRYDVSGASSISLTERRSQFETGSNYYVYLVANSKLDKSLFETVETLGDLYDTKQEDLNLYLSGLNAADAPKYFLMDAVAKDASEGQTVTLNNGQAADNTILSATLCRAAAKVMININTAENIEFTTFEGEIDNGVYYIRNLPYEAYLLAEARSQDEVVSQLVTTGKGVNGHFTWNPSLSNNNVTLVTYVYPHNWADDSILEKEPCVVVNLPLIVKSGSAVKEYRNSWYKIHMTNGKQFLRNNCYKTTINLNRPGASSDSTPIEVENIYYEVDKWIEQTITVGEETNRPTYLQLNTDHIDMYNINTDATSLEFASSSPIAADGIRLLEAYYYNSVDAKVNVSSQYPSAYRGIKATAESGVLNGNITIHSPFVAEAGIADSHSNTIRYMTFEVTNADGQKATFTVNQYPTIYITNELGNYSYRSDFGGTTYVAQGSENRSGVTWDNSTKGWNYYSDKPSNVTLFFESKYVRSGPDQRGTYDIDYYYWRNSRLQTVVNGTFNNPRMYHVHVTATSPDYVVARPKMDGNYTDSSPENTRLVSPSFMIASQLGATNTPYGGFGGYGSLNQLEGGIEQAKKHCEQYVEVAANGNVYDDWRLPTAAEIDIIIQHQYASDAMAEVLSGSRYYCSYYRESGQPDDTKSSEGGSSGSCHVRCIRDAY